MPDDLERAQRAAAECDVFLALGTSLGVYPAAALPEIALSNGARLVIVNAARVIATGAAIGLLLSALSGRLIETMLFGVRPLDLATFAFVTIVLAVTAALSIAGPAWRAARIDPAVALRNK